MFHNDPCHGGTAAPPATTDYRARRSGGPISPPPPTTTTATSTTDNDAFGSGASWASLHSLLLRKQREQQGGLEDVPLEQLQHCLEPVLAGLQQLDAERLLQLRRVDHSGDGARLTRDRVQVQPIHNEITPQNNDNDDESHRNAVRYIHLSEVPDQYSIGIFVFPPHAKIPLHDHPGMCVISRVLYGDLQRLSLDLPRETPPQQQQNLQNNNDNSNARSSSWLPWSQSWATTTTHDAEQQQQQQQQQGRLAYKNKVDRLVAPECTVLYPFEGNLHEFMAGPHGAAVLDVLLPPYDTHGGRDCTFYEIVHDDIDDDDYYYNNINGDHSNKNRATMDNSAADDDHFQQHRGDPCWIVPTGQPEDFHCISGKYRQLG